MKSKISLNDFIDCKTNNTYRNKILQTSKEQLKPQLCNMNKLFLLQEQIQTIGSPRESKITRGFSEHFNFKTQQSPKSFASKLDEKLPLKELTEIANNFDKQTTQQVRMLSKNYVNEMVQLASCIEKKLKVVKKY